MAYVALGDLFIAMKSTIVVSVSRIGEDERGEKKAGEAKIESSSLDKLTVPLRYLQ